MPYHIEFSAKGCLTNMLIQDGPDGQALQVVYSCVNEPLYEQENQTIFYFTVIVHLH